MLDASGKYEIDESGVYALGVVHTTLNRAQFVIDELKLTGAYPMSIGHAMSARQFRKIVVMFDPMPFTEYLIVEWVKSLERHLVPGGKLLFLV